MKTEERLAALLGSLKLDLADEKRAQGQIADALHAAGIVHEREKRLAPGDIVDFLIDGVAVEVKLRGAPKRKVFRQLERYAGHDTVTSVMLVSNLSMGLPKRIGGKDAYFVSLGRAWL